MYHSIGIQKLSENQLSRLRNGHPVRIKIGSHHKIHLSVPQLKKLHTANKHGKASTITFDPYQIEAHGSGVFGDIARKAKQFIQKHNLQHIVNPIIQGAKQAGHRGVHHLSHMAHSHLNKIQPVGEGILGDIASMINPTIGSVAKMAGLGVARKHNTHKSHTKSKRTHTKGKGLLADIAKSTAKQVAKKGIEIGANYLNNKVDGMGSRVKPHLYRKKRTTKKRGGALYPAGCNGGALFPA